MRYPGYVAAYVILLALLTVASFALPQGVLSGDLVLTPDDRAKSSLDILREIQVFVGTLTTALFAGVGAFVAKTKDGQPLRRSEGYAIVFALVAGAASYYGLYLSRVALLEMAAAGVIDPRGSRLQAALALQYYGFLTGAALLGLLFVLRLDSTSQTSSLKDG